MKLSTLFVGLALAGLSACQDTAVTNPIHPTSNAVKTLSTVAGPYIVTLRSHANVNDVAKTHGASPRWIYRKALNGFASDLTSAQITALRNDPDVLSVTPDGMMYVTTDQLNPPSWGLDRIDQRSLPLDLKYSYFNNGAGVNFYDIDTGIRTDHVDFTGRIGVGVNLSGASGGVEDCNGHGTHTAGTVAGTTYGVAKGVIIHPVRVFGCSNGAATSIIIAAVDWVTTNAVKPAVVNMSLGGPFDAPTNQAVENSIAAGIVYSVSAGNSNADACNVSPASAPDAITVGATMSNDTRASFSNFGSCVDIWAPGVSITSDWLSSSTSTAVLSGTSMAAPHTTGTAALILSAAPSLTPGQVADLIRQRSTKRGLIDPDFDGDLLYTGTDTMATPPGTRPTANFSQVCVFTTCDFTNTSLPGSSAITTWTWPDNWATDPRSGSGTTFHTVFHIGGNGYGYTNYQTLQVTNGDGLSSRTTHTLSLVSPISFTTSVKTVKGVKVATIVWTGVRGDSLTIMAQNQSIGAIISARAKNTGTYQMSLPKVTGSNTTFYFEIFEDANMSDWQRCIG